MTVIMFNRLILVLVIVMVGQLSIMLYSIIRLNAYKQYHNPV